ncbi:MAG: class I SAM-dependent methyltransferase, partial [Verrucomicrobia bacterium]|nr:class I SAM-dependent methyltransferase [Cytophagales bacterium]
EYLQNNPGWHIEDSPWKAKQILKILNKNELQPQNLVEIGCGAGEILNQLHQQMNNKVNFYGYEISPDAFALAMSRSKERLNFFNEDLIEKNVFFDVLLMIDVFEHVEDYIGFIKKCKNVAIYKIFHIPLDISILSVLRVTPITNVRQSVGHLHYFTKETALGTLKDAGYEILDYFYTPGMLELSGKGFKTKLLNPFRKILFSINPDFAVRFLGGYSLLVLTK